MRHPFCSLFAAIAAGCAWLPLSPMSASAALLVHEPFDYTVGSPISGQNGGIGFAGSSAWEEMFTATHSPEPDVIAALNMDFGDLDASPNALRSIQATGTMGRRSEVWREIAPIPLFDGRVLWLSFLIQRTAGTASDLTNYTLMLGADRNVENSLGFGKILDTVNYGLRGPLETRAAGNVEEVLSVTNFLVVKITFGDLSETVDLYVNPALGTEPTGAPDARLTGAGVNIDSVRYLGVYAENLQPRQWSMDEIRIGDTFGDVTPTIPEPSAALALLGGAVTLVGLGRLRSKLRS
jgi:hypothetical protein